MARTIADSLARADATKAAAADARTAVDVARFALDAATARLGGADADVVAARMGVARDLEKAGGLAVRFNPNGTATIFEILGPDIPAFDFRETTVKTVDFVVEESA